MGLPRMRMRASQRTVDPKFQAPLPISVQTALASAVLQWNKGAEAALQVLLRMNITPSSQAITTAQRRNSKRIAGAERKATSAAKRQRQESRVERKQLEDELSHQEGVTYRPGGF